MENKIKANEIIRQILENYDNFADKENVTEFIREQLRYYKISADEEEIRKTADNISDTIDELDKAFQDLQAFKKQGKSRELWLEKQLENMIDKIPENQHSEFINTVKTSLSQANQEILPDISSPLKSTQFKDINKTAITKNIQQDIRNNALINALIFEQGFKEEKPDIPVKEIKAVKEFFESPMDSPQDKAVKKIVSAGTVIAKEKGFIKPLENKTVPEIATIVDYGVTASKLAYKVGTGSCSAHEAIDYMVDKATATASSIIKKALPSACAALGGTIGMAIGSVFSPAAADICAEVGEIIGYSAGEAITPVIQKGIEKVGNVVKEVAKKTWDIGQKAVNYVEAGAKKLFAKLFG